MPNQTGTETMSQREWVEKDYYAVLGVPAGASQSDIRKAYRKLAQKYHPDANRGDASAEERFKEVSQAYDVLGNTKKRKEYDQMREMLRSGFGRFTSGTQDVRFEDLGDLFGGGRASGGIEDLLSNFFTRGSGRAAMRGMDLEGEASISFEDALVGKEISLSLNDPSVGPRNVRIRIPPGVTDGSRIRIRGKGSPGQGGGPAGDLFVRVRVGKHPIFGRKGQSDLTLALPITFAEAALGGEVEAPTLNGSVTLKIPPGTPSGKTFRVRGQGAEVKGTKGDLLVTVEVAVPTRLSKESRELLEKFAKTQNESPREHLKGN